MGQSSPRTAAASANPEPYLCRFLIGQDDEGHWIARDGRGLTGGLFVSKDAAIRFAAFESDRRADAVQLVPGNVRLTLAGELPRL